MLSGHSAQMCKVVNVWCGSPHREVLFCVHSVQNASSDTNAVAVMVLIAIAASVQARSEVVSKELCELLAAVILLFCHS